jgi:adenylate kinase
LALVAGIAWRRTRDREGRIRLEEEVEEAERQERAAEIEAAAANGTTHARRR